jgi:hypothetical protein
MRKKITRRTTCIDLYCYEEINYSCQRCYSIIDIFSNNRKKRTNTIKCERPWLSSYATNNPRALFHLEVCNYLGLSTEVTILEEYKRNTDISPSAKKSSNNDKSNSICLKTSTSAKNKTNQSSSVIQKSIRPKTSSSVQNKTNNSSSKIQEGKPKSNGEKPSSFLMNKTNPSSSKVQSLKQLSDLDLLSTLCSKLYSTCPNLQQQFSLGHSTSVYSDASPPVLFLKHPAPPNGILTNNTIHSEITLSESEESTVIVDSESDSDSNSVASNQNSYLYESVSKTKMSNYIQKARIVDRMRSKFKNCTRTAYTKPESRAFIATGLSHCPALSSNSAAVLFSCVINAFLTEIGVNIDPEKVAASCPGKDTLCSMLDDEGINILAIIRTRMAGKKKFFSCDGANKGIHHVVKVISWWYVDRVMYFLLDADAAIGDNKQTALASDVSMKKIDPIEGTKEKVHGLCTDAGGGGTSEGLAQELSLVNRTIPLHSFLITTCSHHGMNRMMQSPCEKFFGDGGLLNRNLIQLLFTCWSIQDKYEMGEWRSIWKKTNNESFGDKFQEPVYTRWEYVGTACCQFLPKINGFQKVAKCITNVEKAGSERSKVASDLYSLIGENILISMAYFLSAYHLSFWLPNFSWLKMIDPITKVSGYASRHMSTRTFIVSEQLKKLKITWSVEPEFKEFISRRALHTGNEETILYKDLPRLFFEDVSCMFEKHMVKQWCSTKLLKLTIASIPEIATSFARWIFNLPIENKSIFSEIHNTSIHLPSCIQYITQYTSVTDIQSDTFITQFQSAIKKIAFGELLFDSIDSEVLELQEYVKESFLPLPSSTQLVESKVKDMDFCGSTGRDEGRISNLAMIRSVTLPQVTLAVKESEQFKSRKRKNDEARDYVYGQRYTSEVLTGTYARQEELSKIDVAEIEHCREVLSKKNHFKKRRHDDTLQKYSNLMNKEKRDNTAMQVKGVHYTPLILGKVQLGKITNAQRELLIEELKMRNITVSRNELITKMKAMLIADEHPNTSDEKLKKFFFPKLLTAADWSKDNLEATLVKIEELRSCRL